MKTIDTQSGYVAIIGRPNVGKSTLLNQLLGEVVSITTHKAQTTRDKILGVFTQDDLQLIFLDSPGIHQSQKTFNLFMVAEALSAVADADLILFLVEYQKEPVVSNIEKRILEYISKRKQPVILIINKIDQTKGPHELMAQLSFWKEQGDFAEIIPLSALKGFDQKMLVRDFRKYIPKHPFYFPDDFLTDRNDRFTAGEMIREQVLLQTHQEIPYETAIEIDRYAEINEKLEIEASIIVSRKSQKMVVLGEKGQMIKQIGIAARLELEKVFGVSVYLKLFVKVEQNWHKKLDTLEKVGYKSHSENDLDEFFS